MPKSVIGFGALANEVETVFSGAFGFEEGLVGLFDEFIGGAGVPGEGGESAGDGQGALGLGSEFGELVAVEHFAEAVHDGEGGSGVFAAGRTGRLGIPEDEGEFIAAESGGEVLSADALSDEDGGFAEDFIAGWVAVAVVVVFEVVEVEDDQGDSESLIAGFGDQVAEDGHHVAAVGQAGDRVGVGQFPQLNLGAGQADQSGQEAEPGTDLGFVDLVGIRQAHVQAAGVAAVFEKRAVEIEIAWRFAGCRLAALGYDLYRFGAEKENA